MLNWNGFFAEIIELGRRRCYQKCNGTFSAFPVQSFRKFL